jgi:peptidoglycan/xylan/chitin deacetylase (PgdA/CDA1 family)
VAAAAAIAALAAGWAALRPRSFRSARSVPVASVEAPRRLDPAPPDLDRLAARTAEAPKTPIVRAAAPPAPVPASLPSGIRIPPARAVVLAPPAPSGGEKKIVLSFDAGSTDRGAAEILDALRGRGIRTTVFLTGQFIRRYPELARRIASDGHEVGNHTFDHPHLTTYAIDGRQRTRPGVTEEMVRRELEETASLYGEVTGRAMAPLWRAPYGEENDEIIAWARSAGYRHVSWTHGEGRNMDALDWVSDPDSPRYRTSDRVINRLLASARPGSIILMHLGSEREDPVAGHLPRLLDTLSSEGYRFSTASELIASGASAR